MLKSISTATLIAITSASFCTEAYGDIQQGSGGRMEGVFVNHSADLKIIQGNDDEPDVYYMSVGVASGGCSGHVAGQARAVDKTTVVMVVPSEFGRTHACILVSRFGSNFTSVKTSEEGCLAFHGAGCDFDQTLQLKR